MGEIPELRVFAVVFILTQLLPLSVFVLFVVTELAQLFMKDICEGQPIVEKGQ